MLPSPLDGGASSPLDRATLPSPLTVAVVVGIGAAEEAASEGSAAVTVDGGGVVVVPADGGRAAAIAGNGEGGGVVVACAAKAAPESPQDGSGVAAAGVESLVNCQSRR